MKSNLFEPFVIYICSQVGAESVSSVEKIQSLWSGYGGIYRLQLDGSEYSTVIVKLIDLQESQNHPRGWATDLSHQRKLKSYQIENYWYDKYVSSLPENIKVPSLLYSEKRGDVQVLVLEDLSADYPLLKSNCTFNEAKVVVSWLANFHAFFLGNSAKGLWPIGSYWHLETRPDEWEAMQGSPLKAKAKKIDSILNHAKYKTIIHGDAKVANFCFSQNAKNVAAVDFQYVGGGVGVKDLAYFLGSCFTSEECELYEEEMLNHYFKELISSVDLNGVEIAELEKEWRNLYPFAWADFNRFLLGWLPSHQKLHKHALSKNKEALKVIRLK